MSRLIKSGFVPHYVDGDDKTFPVQRTTGDDPPDTSDGHDKVRF